MAEDPKLTEVQREKFDRESGWFAEQIRKSKEAIEQSKALIRRIDRLLSKTDLKP